jgi:hypothetical protein
MKKVRLNAGLFCESRRVAESRRLIELPKTARKKKFAWLERGLCKNKAAKAVSRLPISR